MEVSNLRSSGLTYSQVKSLAACLPSLQCGPRIDDEQFDQMWCKEMFGVRKFSSTSKRRVNPPSAGSERRRHHPSDCSHLLLATPVHPEQIDIQTLANTQNHFNIMEFEGRTSVRVTSSVHSPDGRESQRKWRVSDYNLEGEIILSVIFSMTMDMTGQ